MVLPNPIPRYLPHFLVVALRMAVPSAAAHNVTPVESRTGDITLGPSGTAQALYHQFGFNMAGGDFLHIECSVTSPLGQTVDFSLHRHNSTATVELLNLTHASDYQELRVPDPGFYMPQWLNMVGANVTVHYNLAYYKGPTTLDLVYGIVATVVPVALLGLFAWGFLRERRDRKRAKEGQGKPP